MLFSEDSSKLTKFFIDNFDDLHSFKKKTKDNMNDVLKTLYIDINRADNFIKLLKKTGKIEITVKEVSNYSEMPQTSHMQSNYVMEKARTYVKENIKGYIQCSVKLDSRDIFIYFTLFKNSDFNNLKKYNIYFYWMLVWLKVSNSYTHSSCARELKVFGFLTPFKKKLPNSQLKTLSPENCNSGVTTSCTGKGEICIYREEEFFKLFIHESFHILGLDFSAMGIPKLKKKIHNLFPIKSRFEMHEAYTEFWANMLNCLFCSYRLLDDKKDIKTFLQYSDFFLRLEKIFSLFQMTKILNFMGCHYTNLYNSDDSSVMIRKCLYKEDTNVFPYYIAKTILLYNNISFIKWCQRENKNILNFNNKEESTLAFFDFIREKYDNKYMLNDINNMEKFIEKLNDKTLLETLRMTIIEI